MVLVDTDVLAYLLIEGDRTRDAQRLYAHDAQWVSEAFVFVEFCNVLATCERTGALAADESERLLGAAEGCIREATRIPAIAALRVARRYAVSAYDARFLAAAEALGLKLITEDARLRAAAPALTQSIAQALAV